MLCLAYPPPAGRMMLAQLLAKPLELRGTLRLLRLCAQPRQRLPSYGRSFRLKREPRSRLKCNALEATEKGAGHCVSKSSHRPFERISADRGNEAAAGDPRPISPKRRKDLVQLRFERWPCA